MRKRIPHILTIKLPPEEHARSDAAADKWRREYPVLVALPPDPLYLLSGTRPIDVKDLMEALATFRRALDGKK